MFLRPKVMRHRLVCHMFLLYLALFIDHCRVQFCFNWNCTQTLQNLPNGWMCTDGFLRQQTRRAEFHSTSKKRCNTRLFPKWMSLNSANSVNHQKSPKNIVGTTYLDIVTFPVIVVESTFSLLPLGRYLLPQTTLNRYFSRYSSNNFISTTSSVNITITRHGVFLVTIPILCFVMIHWIQWKSSRENSNGHCFITLEHVHVFFELYLGSNFIIW